MPEKIELEIKDEEKDDEINLQRATTPTQNDLLGVMRKNKRWWRSKELMSIFGIKNLAITSRMLLKLSNKRFIEKKRPKGAKFNEYIYRARVWTKRKERKKEK